MKIIECSIGKDHYAIGHVKQLPCGNIACYECIKNELYKQAAAGRRFSCIVCNQEHIIRSENELSDFDIESLLLENKNEILSQFSQNLESCLKRVEGKLVKL
jgi:hypothetical protein